jgi:hypothetical protein
VSELNFAVIELAPYFPPSAFERLLENSSKVSGRRCSDGG